MNPDLISCDNVGVKICGIQTLDDAFLSIEKGADSIGLNFWNKSKRYVSRKTVEGWIDKLDPRVERVGVFVNADPMVVKSMLIDGLIHVAQFHGNETNEYCNQFNDQFKIIKAFGVKSPKSVEQATKCTVQTILLDSYCGNDFGGSGHTFEWEFARVFQNDNLNRPIILAGGLNVSNVAKAIKELSPSAVDVASGVENGQGYKDPELVERFIKLVKQSSK